MEHRRACITVAMAMMMMAVLPYNCMAMVFPVGDSQQWKEGVDYVTWAIGKTFHVGDKLKFIYEKAHDVTEVSKSAYDSCTANNSLQTYNGGDSIVTLDRPGARYFICGNPGHCSEGMKLAITVPAASSITPSTTPSTTASPPLPSTTGTTSESSAVATSLMQIKDCVVLVGSVLLGSLAVRML